MKRLGLMVLVACSACDFLPGGGGGTGGGSGGGGEQPFSKGFVFVRRDDKNVYLSDQADLMTVTRLTDSGGAKQPSFDKEARRVVFVKSTGTDSEVDIVPTTGGTPTTVIASTTASVKNLRTPVFSLDGQRVFFAYDDGASSSIGVVNTDGSMFQRLAAGSALAYAGISLYPDGSALLATAGNSVTQLTQLERISTLNGQATSVTNALGSEATSIVSRAVVSPDAKKAAFDARLASGSVRIFVIDLATKVVTQLTDYPGEPGANDNSPCWKGSDVCFSSDTGGGDSVYALPSTGMMTSGGLQLAGGVEPWFGPN
ncbi:MAG: hypothetical protein IPJ65_01320 [Archangiaceae bacterium]|nr:hypothetical protein [Archangiaceae bacterium]